MSTKAKILSALMGAGALLIAASPAKALFVDPPAGTTFTGLTYTAGPPGGFGAAHRTEVEGDLEAAYPSLGDIIYIGRVGRDGTTLYQDVPDPPPTVLSGACTSATGCSEGTWAFNSTQYLIAFIEITTAGDARIYQLTPFALSGVWNTAGFPLTPGGDRKNLSHFDLFGIEQATTNVPEPSAMLLLGLGLTGLALIRRRRPSANVMVAA